MMKNRIDPELREMLEQFPPLDLDNYETTRQAMAEEAEMNPIPDDDAVQITEKMIPGPEDNPSVRVITYEPKEKSDLLPALLWIHGGGYVLGSADENKDLCQQFVKEANCIVVSVDYRLAPDRKSVV